MCESAHLGWDHRALCTMRTEPLNRARRTRLLLCALALERPAVVLRAQLGGDVVKLGGGLGFARECERIRDLGAEKER